MASYSTCEVCGWACRNVWKSSLNDCKPALGAAARALGEAAARIGYAVQTFGWGYGCIALTKGQMTVVFQIVSPDPAPAYRLCGLYGNAVQAFSLDTAERLVTALEPHAARSSAAQGGPPG
jgi:hypothetical protein